MKDYKVSVSAMLAVLTLSGSAYAASEFSGHHVYVNTNDVANKVIHYAQTVDGQLTEISRLPTSGRGTGGYKALTNQVSAPDDIVSAGAVALSDDHKWLFVVNAGDNSVSSFSIGDNGEPHFVDRKSAGENSGVNSVSYNDKKNVLYIGHSFGPSHITVFKVNEGKLSLMPGASTVNTLAMSDRVLTQVQLDPSGKFLLANVLYDKRPEKVNGKFRLWPSNKSEKNALAVFPVMNDGKLGEPRFFDAGGESPFGLRFIDGGKGDFVNTLDQDPGFAVLSHLNEDGTITNRSIATAQVAVAGKTGVGACWVSFSPDGKTAFVTGYDTGEVVSFSINGNRIAFAKGRQGVLEKSDLSNESSAVSTGAPVGSWSSKNGYFYQLYPGAAKLVAYKISGESLHRLESYAVPLNSTQGITGF
ncbi:hypothetical protein E5C26_05525 [Serratia proteamaculans]|uniref:beta-propeller fold lactonase family protein n=1 Tax=Serratia proteamaculans TaxID=28151 RepID=UPI001076A9D7|nr:beta-propeller fold lactonase family protein [Serratia proteamaculans]TFZ52665.1 hypothetical protein E5C26_05525 [Serratia proteamaculans]